MSPAFLISGNIAILTYWIVFGLKLGQYAISPDGIVPWWFLGHPLMVLAGKSDTFVNVYIYSRHFDLLFRHKILDWGTAAWYKLANLSNYTSHWWYKAFPSDVIRLGSSAWLAQISRSTACCGSFKGENGSRHLLLVDLRGILRTVVVLAGCTAVVSFRSRVKQKHQVVFQPCQHFQT